MNFAKCLMKNGTWISKLYVSDILDGRVSENDILEAYCPCCSKQAYFVHSDIRILHLASRHSPSCDFVNDGRIHKKIIKVIDKKLDVFSLLNYIDGPVRGRGGGENGGGEDPGEDGPDESGPINTIDDIDTIEVETIASVNTVRGLVLSYKEYGGEKECGGGFRLKDIIATQSTFFGYRKKGINHPLAVTCVRLSPKSSQYRELNVPVGYTCLMDAFTGNPKNAIYFFVKLHHKEQEAKFRELMSTPKGGKDSYGYKYKYVTVFADWKRVENDSYQIYQSDINSHCYVFMNKVPKDEEDA